MLDTRCWMQVKHPPEDMVEQNKTLVLIQYPVTRIQNHVLILKINFLFQIVNTTLMILANA